MDQVTILKLALLAHQFPLLRKKVAQLPEYDGFNLYQTELRVKTELVDKSKKRVEIMQD